MGTLFSRILAYALAKMPQLAKFSGRLTKYSPAVLTRYARMASSRSPYLSKLSGLTITIATKLRNNKIVARALDVLVGIGMTSLASKFMDTLSKDDESTISPADIAALTSAKQEVNRKAAALWSSQASFNAIANSQLWSFVQSNIMFLLFDPVHMFTESTTNKADIWKSLTDEQRSLVIARLVAAAKMIADTSEMPQTLNLFGIQTMVSDDTDAYPSKGMAEAIANVDASKRDHMETIAAMMSLMYRTAHDHAKRTTKKEFWSEATSWFKEDPSSVDFSDPKIQDLYLALTMSSLATDAEKEFMNSFFNDADQDDDEGLVNRIIVDSRNTADFIQNFKFAVQDGNYQLVDQALR